MGWFGLVRPQDDRAARQSSDWADSLEKRLTALGHAKSIDVDDWTPADTSSILNALGSSAALLCYFGHGDESSWLTNGLVTIDASHMSAARSKAIVSIACKTACLLGPSAITAGVESWLGFTVKVAVISPHKGIDPIGDAIVEGLAVLGAKATMQQSRDEIAAQLDQVVTDYDTGKYSTHPAAPIGYFAAMCLRDHVVVHGNVSFQPLP